MAIMDTQLNTWLLLDHAPTHFSDIEIVTQVEIDKVHRYTYGDFAKRTYSLMHAIDSLGLDQGARVGTMSFNAYRHLECYFAIPCTGRVLHTLNPRLSPEDLAFIINDAGDEAIFVAPEFLSIVESISDQIPSVKFIITLGDFVPNTKITNAICYEDLISDFPTSYNQRQISENTPAGLCYTSGTTGRPKGALYTHRSTYLHAIGCALPGSMGIGPSDCILPAVPMFHASAWGMVHAATAVGAKQVFALGNLHPPSFVKLLAEEEVTLSAGVPTIWIAIAEELSKNRVDLPYLRELIVGGSQPPKPLIEKYRKEFGLNIVQAWGMTETSPLSAVARVKQNLKHLPEEQILEVVRGKAGLPSPGISISLRDTNNNEVPWDGETMGNLLVKGAWVIDSYLHGRGADSFSDDGWFTTGDIAIGYPEGYFVIADRSKDVIKSGGEWISSVDMEGAIMGMEGVIEAAVVAVPDPKWQERPIAFVVPVKGVLITLEEVHKHLTKKGFAKWQLPDRVEIIEAVPRTSVGKFDKKVLRNKYS